jgi:hypothetical protein
MRLQDLFLILSQCVDLGRLSITAAFIAAGDLKKILSSRFEIIRISQYESPRVFLRSGECWRQAVTRSALSLGYRTAAWDELGHFYLIPV